MGILDGKVALITGAGQGVARDIAPEMSKEGAAIAVVVRNGETAAETGNSHPRFGRKCPATGPRREELGRVNACLAFVVDAVGTVDIL